MNSKSKIRFGGFPFTATFDAFREDVLNVLEEVKRQFPDLMQWSLPFDVGEEKLGASLSVGEMIKAEGLDVIPVAFTDPDVDPITQRHAFLDFLRKQMSFADHLESPHLMLLPEAWRHNVGKAPLKGEELKVFIHQTANGYHGWT